MAAAKCRLSLRTGRGCQNHFQPRRCSWCCDAMARGDLGIAASLSPVSNPPLFDPFGGRERICAFGLSLRVYDCFGSSVVDHKATSARSRSVTVICPVAPAICTCPKNALPADGVGEFVRSERAGMQRSRDELPERLEILEPRLVGIVIVGCGVVHVGGQPDRVVDRRGLDE